jgi:hypothetical protein
MRLSLPAKKSPPVEDLGNDRKAIGAQLATQHRWLPQTLRGAIYDARVSIEKAETSTRYSCGDSIAVCCLHLRSIPKLNEEAHATS